MKSLIIAILFLTLMAVNVLAVYETPDPTVGRELAYGLTAGGELVEILTDADGEVQVG